jgi:polar amino acid transport system substrate-binding protein
MVRKRTNGISLYAIGFLVFSMLSANLHASSAHALEPQQRGDIVIAGGDHDYPPYEFLDENGNPAGYNVDLVKAVGEVMGLRIDVRLGPWSEVRSALENGKIDMLAGMF